MIRKREIPWAVGGIPFIRMAVIGILPNPLKILYYKRKGAIIGPKVRLGLGSYINSPRIILEEGVRIAPFTFIRARQRCVIGKRSQIKSFTAIETGILDIQEDVTISEQVVIGGIQTSRSELTIGSRSRILPFCVLNPTESLRIGKDVCIGGGTYVFTHGTWQNMLEGFPGKFAPVKIDDGAWIAWRCFVMPGVHVGSHATIGGSSVVTHDVPARSLAVGAPAKVIKHDAQYIRSLTQAEKDSMIKDWLKECAAYFNYMGYKAAFIEQKNEQLQLGIEDLNGNYTTLFYVHGKLPEALNASSGIISLESLDTQNRQLINEVGAFWFDLESKECSFSKQPMAEQFKDFIARYGVRFAMN